MLNNIAFSGFSQTSFNKFNNKLYVHEHVRSGPLCNILHQKYQPHSSYMPIELATDSYVPVINFQLFQEGLSGLNQ